MFQKLRNLSPTKVSEWGKQAIKSQREKLEKAFPQKHKIIFEGICLTGEVVLVFGRKYLSINWNFPPLNEWISSNEMTGFISFFSVVSMKPPLQNLLCRVWCLSSIVIRSPASLYSRLYQFHFLRRTKYDSNHQRNRWIQMRTLNKHSSTFDFGL